MQPGEKAQGLEVIFNKRVDTAWGQGSGAGSNIQ